MPKRYLTKRRSSSEIAALVKEKEARAEARKKVIAEKKSATIPVILQWVFDNMDGRVNKRTAPSPGAHAYLMACRKDDGLKRKFYDNWSKMATRADMEAAERHQDDGRTEIALIDRVLKAKLNAQSN